MYLNVFINRKRADIDTEAYAADADRMVALAAQQPGFLRFRSFHADDGEVVAISEWASMEDAKAWRRHPEHMAVQAKGRAEYYESYSNYCCAAPHVSHFTKGAA